jgi:hypothetical protein
MVLDGMILQQVLAAATICKILVDLVRQTTKCEGWMLPILAIIFGISASILISLSINPLITVSIISQSIIAGILAAGSAMGVTELQKRAL